MGTGGEIPPVLLIIGRSLRGTDPLPYGPVLYRWTKKIHMYSGLLSFLGLTVWGIVGVESAFRAAPETRERPQPVVRFIDFETPSDIADPELAQLMVDAAKMPFITSAPRHTRDKQNRLSMTYFTTNGRRRLVLLEDEAKIRVEAEPVDFWGFLSSAHVNTILHSRPAWQLKFWGAYNEMSLWAVIFMAVSGIYMWLATRPKLAWASWTLGAGCAAFVVFYVSVR